MPDDICTNNSSNFPALNPSVLYNIYVTSSFVPAVGHVRLLLLCFILLPHPPETALNLLPSICPNTAFSSSYCFGVKMWTRIEQVSEGRWCNSSSYISPQKTVWMMNLICIILSERCACGLRLTIYSIFLLTLKKDLNNKISIHAMQMTTASSKSWLCTFMRQSAAWTALALTHLPFGAEGLKWVCSW